MKEDEEATPDRRWAVAVVVVEAAVGGGSASGFFSIENCTMLQLAS